MVKGQVITISPDGVISGLQVKKGRGVDLRSFGPASIKRVSEIAFDDEAQLWYVSIIDGPFKGNALTIRMWSDTVSAGGWVEPKGLRMPDGWKPDSVMTFLDYDEAVEAEIAFLNAARSQGVF